jgi:hypothetical protein
MNTEIFALHDQIVGLASPLREIQMFEFGARFKNE